MKGADADRIWLADMLECIEKTLRYTAGGREEFLEDELRRDGVARNLEILGEAAKRVSPGLRAENPDVPWKDIAGLRDKLIHDYGQVDIQRVWDIVEARLPALRARLQQILKQHGWEEPA